MKGDKNKVYIIFYKGYFSNKNIKNEKGKCIILELMSGYVLG